MLSMKNISFSYEKKRVKKQIVDDFSLHVSPGECVVIAGKNGAGKSTLLSIAAGIIKPDSGSIDSGGKIAYVPQGSALPEDMTVEECLKFFATLSKCTVPDTLPFSVNEIRKQRISSLSGGMKKQVSIACATLSDPPIILLDEPCAALDLIFRDEMAETILEWKRKNKAIVYVGHDPMEFYNFFDTLIILGDKVSSHRREDIPRKTADAESFAEFFKSQLIL